MSISIPTQVLADALHDRIKGRSVREAVFTTFSFDPGFFEKEILPILFDQSFSHMPDIRLQQLEKALRGIPHVAVYFDRGHLQDNDPPKLDVQRFPMSRRQGYFHPKLALILVEDAKNNPASRSLIVGVFSANLTQSGWWENLECGEILEATEGKPCSFKDDLLGICNLLRSSDTAGRDHAALDAIQAFVKQLDETTPRSPKRMLHPRLFYGDEKIISPYFESSESPEALKRLIDCIQPRETRIFLPTNDAGEGLYSEKYSQAIQQYRQVAWGRLPWQLLQRGAATSNQSAKRFVHAKLYRLWSRSEGHEYLLVGSPNMTLAAHGTFKSGNVEVAALIDLGRGRKPSFWLDKIPDHDVPKPADDREPDGSDEVEESQVPPIAIRYDWKRKKANYYWESGSPPEWVELSFGQVLQITLRRITAGQWQDMPAEASETLQRLLNTTAFLYATSSDGKSGTIVVEESGMEQKPTLQSTLTASEIFRSWSLLTPDQEGDTTAGTRKGTGNLVIRPRPRNVESFFDHFAGIFHAFAKLEKYVIEAIASGNYKNANYRLFGKQYDSLPTLIAILNTDKDTQPERVEAKESDLVARYVTLLTAKQVVDRLQQRGKILKDRKEAKAWKAFVDEQSKEFGSLKRQLNPIIARIRKSFSFDTAEERKEFFKWFDHWFLKDMSPTEEA